MTTGIPETLTLKTKIPEWISFLFFCATCSERKIDRILKKNCKYQRGFLHPKKIFLQFCNDSSGFSLQKESSLLLLSLCRHVLKTRWKVHRDENATETTPVPRAWRVSERAGGRPTPSGYHSRYPAPSPCWSKKSNIPGYAQNQVQGYDI